MHSEFLPHRLSANIDPSVIRYCYEFFQKAVVEARKKYVPASMTAENHQYAEDFKTLKEFTVSWIQEYLGIYVGHREPLLRDIWIYAPQDQGFEELEEKKVAGVADRLLGLIRMKHQKNSLIFFQNYIHELCHLLAASNLTLHRPKGWELSSAGLELNEKFTTLNEAITDMLSFEILLSYSEQKGEDYLKKVPVPYKTPVILFGMLMTEIAQRTNETPMIIRRNFYSAYFNGDSAFLRIIEHLFSKGSLKYLSQFPKVYDDYTQITDFCDHFGLDEQLFYYIYTSYEAGSQLFEYLDLQQMPSFQNRLRRKLKRQ
jgi:hypothetical protein